VVKEAQEGIPEGPDSVFQGGTADSRIRLELFGQRWSLKLEQYIVKASLPEMRSTSKEAIQVWGCDREDVVIFLRGDAQLI
jgi:hypothetical protein